MHWLSLFLLAWIGVAAGQQRGPVDIAGVRFDERARIGAAESVLNGAGLRSVLGIKFYVIGVYLPQKQTNPNEVLRIRGAKRLQIVTLRDLTTDMFAVDLVKGMRRNLSEAEFNGLRKNIEMLSAAVHATDHAPRGSVIQFDWLPAAGAGAVTRLSVNGLQRGKDIPGEAFFQALLKVWLGKKVNDPALRNALLGRTS